jgi:hypothetical protein
MVEPVKRETKKPYSKPAFTVYGTVRELTKHVGHTGATDKPGGGANKTNLP